MILEQVVDFNVRINAALALGDLEDLRKTSLECERFLRHHLPLKSTSELGLERLIKELEQLVEQYKKAVSVVEVAKKEAMDQIHSLSRNRNNTQKYLDVARHLGA